MSNFKRYGSITLMDYIIGNVNNESFEMRSLREQVPNQVHTRNIIGLYNILDGIDGFGDISVFEKYYPYLHEVTAAIKKEYEYVAVEYRSLMLVKLLANEGIGEHIDEAGIYKYAHRIHIPVVTNNGCIFTIGGEEGRMAVGEIVEIDNTVAHSVINGDEDRVHLIVDIMGVKDEYDLKSVQNPIPKQFYFKEN